MGSQYQVWLLRSLFKIGNKVYCQPLIQRSGSTIGPYICSDQTQWSNGHTIKAQQSNGKHSVYKGVRDIRQAPILGRLGQQNIGRWISSIHWRWRHIYRKTFKNVNRKHSKWHKRTCEQLIFHELATHYITADAKRDNHLFSSFERNGHSPSFVHICLNNNPTSNNLLLNVSRESFCSIWRTSVTKRLDVNVVRRLAYIVD